VAHPTGEGSLEIETCQRRGGKLEVIASIEDAALIGPIL